MLRRAFSHIFSLAATNSKSALQKLFPPATHGKYEPLVYM